MERALLFGHDPSARIVGLHPASPGSMRVYRREGNRVVHADEPWFPFFFLTDASLLAQFPKRHWVRELDGKEQFKFLCAFERWEDLWEAVRLLLQRCGIVTASPEDHVADLDVIFFLADPQSQYLLQTGRALFRDMTFAELRRLHIEPRFEPDPASRLTPRLTAILLSDCLGWEVTLDRGSERELLKRLIDTVQKQDPDLLQGPGFYRSTLPRLAELAESLGLPLALGREHRVPSRPPVRFMDPSAPRDAPLWEVPGRQVLDLPRPEAGVSLDPSGRISASQPLALQLFNLAQIAPPAHGNFRFPGLAKRFEHLLLREYIRLRHSVPPLTPRGPAQPDARRLFYSGLLGPAIEAGFPGIYAKALLDHAILSQHDPLAAIPAVVKNLMESLEETPPSASWTGSTRESAFEILLGVIHYYLKTGRTLFGDQEAATELQELAHAKIAEMEVRLQHLEAKLVSVEGERLLIVPPPGLSSADEEQGFLAKIADICLPGVQPILHHRYRRVLCFRKHDLAHLEYDGTCAIRGQDLLPPDLERFGTNFLEGCTKALLTNDFEMMHRIYSELHGAIVRRSWDIRDFARTETITTPMQKYVRDVEEGKREKSAPYEVLLRTGRWLPPGSRVAYYVTQAGPAEAEPTDVLVDAHPLLPGSNAGYAFSRRWRAAEEWDRNFPDEDTAYYLDRLEGLARRFAPFFEPEDYHAIFSSDELFPLDPARIAPITVRVPDEKGEPPPPIHLGIWLDQ